MNANKLKKLLVVRSVSWGLVGLILLSALICFGQASNDTTTKPDAVSRILDSTSARSKKKAAEFQVERLKLRQRRLFENIREASQRAKDYLYGGVDTSSIRREFDKIERWDSLARAGVALHMHAPSSRNVVTTTKILTGLKALIVKRRVQLEKHARRLDGYIYALDSLSSDSVIFVPAGSNSKIINGFVNEVADVIQEVYTVDAALSQASLQVHRLLTRAATQLTRTNIALENLNQLESDVAAATFDNEADYLWSTSERQLGWPILDFSMVRAHLVLKFYSEAHIGEFIIMIVAIVICTMYLYSLRTVLKEEKLFHPDAAGQLVLRYPFLSALVIAICLFQFIFSDPPAVLNFIFWSIASLSLTVIFAHYIGAYWRKIWVSFQGLFFASGIINLILIPAVFERWVILILAIVGVLISVSGLHPNRPELREKRIRYFILLVLILESASTIANLFGRYNLSKNLLTTGYAALIIGVLFLWVVRLINEGLGLSFHAYTLKDRSVFNLNFEKVGTRTPFLLNAGLVIGWFILFARNFYIFKYISDPIKQFVITPRTVGEYSFSIASALLFIAIMLIASIIARVVSFFASDRPRSKNGRPGIGSFLLLVRIGILSIGLFLALAAAGIPLDRVTVILGALSLGIGFGLQTLVNNLISGLIIAFERPVNVGDIIDIQGKVGVMKSIGFRSSRVSIWDGADVIVPNGDLLSGQLVNWTDDDTSTRVNLEFGIAYGTDLRRTEHLLKEVLMNNSGVMAKPEPIVIFQGFGESAINVKVLFWVKNYKEGHLVRSDIIVAIDSTLRQHGITIPYPRRDVHLHTEESKTT